MRISAFGVHYAAQKQSFKGIEKKDDQNMANIAIVGGGGRIGKNAFRQYLLAKHAPKGIYNVWDAMVPIYKSQNIVALNMGSMGLKGEESIKDISDEDLLNQIQNDSILGQLPDSIKLGIKRENGEAFLDVKSKDNEELIKLVATRDSVDFSDIKASIIVDTTGANTTKERMHKHINNGIRYAVLSAPGTDMLTVVPGVNSEMIKDIDKPENANVISAASCTTTCISPYIKLMDDLFGVKNGAIETVHSATATQFIADRTNKKSDSKNRASLDSMIPTTTGAAKAVGLVLPHLKGKLDGFATRVPVANGSMAVITLNLNNNTTANEVKNALEEASNDPKYTNLIAPAPIGSSSKDVLGRHESGLYVPESVKVINGNLLTFKVYYDNEFGYTRSLMTLTGELAKKEIQDNK